MFNLFFRFSLQIFLSSFLTVPPLVVCPTLIGSTCFVFVPSFCLYVRWYIRLLCHFARHPRVLISAQGSRCVEGNHEREQMKAAFQWKAWTDPHGPLMQINHWLDAAAARSAVVMMMWFFTIRCSLRSQNKLGGALMLIVLRLMRHCVFQWFIVPDKYSLISRHCPWYSCSHFQFSL